MTNEQKYKWKVWKQEGLLYYCQTDEGLASTVVRLAKEMHSTQTIKIERAKE